MVTTMIENRIFMICCIACRPTFRRYRTIIHALLLRAYLYARQLFLVNFLRSTVEQYVVEAFKANPSSSRSLKGDRPNHNQTV